MILLDRAYFHYILLSFALFLGFLILASAIKPKSVALADLSATRRLMINMTLGLSSLSAILLCGLTAASVVSGFYHAIF